MTVKKPWICIALGCLNLVLGCNGKNSADSKSEKPSTESQSTSSVPLRILIVSRTGDHEPMKRQWQSVSEQPLNVRLLTAESILGERECDCDIILYPARLLGELVQRGWLKKAKGKSEQDAVVDGHLTAGQSQPVAWKQQTVYAGVEWAKPLGCAIPILLFDRLASFNAQHAPENWDDVLRGSNGHVESTKSRVTSTTFKLDPAKCDADALVDRFLTIANHLSQRNTSYGLLFEMQTMRARIARPEFVEAARILLSIAAESEQSIAATGSWRDAWKWLAGQNRNAVSVGLVGELAEAKEPVTTIGVSDLPQSNSRDLKGSQTVRGWNSGGGLLVSLAESCRQSSRAETFVEWLSRQATRDVLSRSIPGIDADSPVHGVDSSAWQATQLQRSIASRMNQPPELRFPGTEQYRAVLAKQLIRILSGDVNSTTALEQVSFEWDKITDQLGRNDQRTQYEYSLGLSQ